MRVFHQHSGSGEARRKKGGEKAHVEETPFFSSGGREDTTGTTLLRSMLVLGHAQIKDTDGVNKRSFAHARIRILIMAHIEGFMK